jgi:hypothetical protein
MFVYVCLHVLVPNLEQSGVDLLQVDIYVYVYVFLYLYMYILIFSYLKDNFFKIYIYLYMQAMLVFDPTHRITAQDARRHTYFDDLPEALRRVGNDMS